MQPQKAESGFVDPDRFADFVSLEQYLDVVNRQHDIKRHKARIQEALKIRPGDSVLDVGCGSSAYDLVALGAVVGPSGLVLGLDKSERMIDEARSRVAALDLPITFEVGDANAIPFGECTFDRCRSERILQFAQDPGRIVNEMVRVVRPGGRIVLSEPDWATVVIDPYDEDVTASWIKDRAVTNRAQPWIGRHLLALLSGAGACELECFADTLVMREFGAADEVFKITEYCKKGAAEGRLPGAETADWLRALRDCAESNCFMVAITYFAVAGSKRSC